MSTRTDVHRPGAIMPVDYTFVLWYALARTIEGWPEPSQGINCCLGEGAATQHLPNGSCCVLGLKAAGVKWAPTGTTGKCSVCGACYTYGEIWRHEPTGEHIHIGHDCADKYNLNHDRSGWEAWHAKQTALRSQAARDKRFKVAELRFLEDKPELAAALLLDHPILRDMKGKLARFGSLSEKQIAFAIKLANEITAPPKPAEVHVPAPTGRVTVRGVVVSIKGHESQWGYSEKMTVKVATPEGSWLVWSTLPAGLPSDCKGATVEFTATLEHGNNAHFAFGKRPTKARIIEETINA